MESVSGGANERADSSHIARSKRICAFRSFFSGLRFRVVGRKRGSRGRGGGGVVVGGGGEELGAVVVVAGCGGGSGAGRGGGCFVVIVTLLEATAADLLLAGWS